MKAITTTNEQPCFVRFGTVSNYDAQRHMARIKFPDRDDIISGWLPVSVINSAGNHDEAHLDIDSHVLCLMQGNGTESGVVMGSIYDDKNKPLTGNPNVRCTEYEDGTRIEYDRENHRMNINVKGDIVIEGSGSITIKAGGNVRVNGARIDLN